MNIVTALNKKYIPYTSVMLTSLCMNNSSEHIDVYILNTSLLEKDIISLRESLDNYDITIIDIKVDPSEIIEKVPTSDMWSIETYLRLFMLDLLPKNIDRILYLDVDMIINKNITNLYNKKINENTDIIATIDSCGITTFEKMGHKQQEMFAPMISKGYKYFNAGVMLMNINRMRRNYSTNTYLSAMETWNYEMDAPDQDILNYVHWEHIEYVDCFQYDLFSHVAHKNGMSYEYVKNNTSIIHFAGSKPWNTNSLIHFDIEQLWWDYAKYTPYYELLLENFMSTTINNSEIEKQIKNLSDSNIELEKYSRRLLNELQNKEKSSITYDHSFTSEEKEQIAVSEQYLHIISENPNSSAICPMRKNFNNNYDLSIIVPCYNVEKYITSCINSLFAQKTNKKIEIIFINDGSTDNTGSILDKYQKLKNVKIIQQKNKGLSESRNVGLNLASGKYVLFVDSDDIIKENSIDYFLSQVINLDADIYEGGMTLFTDTPSFDSPIKPTITMGNISGFACGKLIRRSLFDNICFPKKYWFEDSIISYLILPKANRVFIDSTLFYGYRQNPEGISALATNSPKSIDTFYIMTQMLKDVNALYDTISEKTFECFLRQIALNYIRTMNLDNNIKVAIFYATRGWYLQNFSSFKNTDNDTLNVLTKSIRLGNYQLYEESCKLVYMNGC